MAGYYAYTRPEALAVAMDGSTTTMQLVDGASLPDPALPGIEPYTVIIGYGTSREEVCTVTAKPTGNTLTVLRHEDGTPATAKNQGDIVVHGVSARDFTTAVRIDDPRLTDARFPTPHAATHHPGGVDPLVHAGTHAANGGDPVAPTSIGALPLDGSVPMAGPLAGPGFNLNGPGNASRALRFQTLGSERWTINPSAGPAESGTSAGSDLQVGRWTNLGVFIDYPVVINRATGEVQVGMNPVTALGVATKQYVDLRYVSILDRTTDTTVAIGATYNPVWEARGTDVNHSAFAWSSAGLTIPVTGIYSARFMIDGTQAAGGRLGLYVMRGGNPIDYGERFYNGTAKALVFSSAIPGLACNAGDVISGRVISYETATTVSVMRLTVAGPL